MWFIFGDTTQEVELGVVADRCPYCGRVSPCRLTGLVRGMHVYFIPVLGSVTEAACVCGRCGGRFAREYGRFACAVPGVDASDLPLDDLLARTNPALRDQLEHAARIAPHQSDPAFASALATIERLRAGRLRSDLLADLLRWGELDAAGRDRLTTRITATGRALDFALAAARRVPAGAGCVPGLLVSLAVWSAFAWCPEVRTMWRGVAVVLGGLAAGGALTHELGVRRFRTWIAEDLLPAAEREGVELASLLAILADLPPSGRHATHELHELKDHEALIRAAVDDSPLSGAVR